MRGWMIRLFSGLLFALPFGLVTVAWAQAYSPSNEGASNTQDCRECHGAFYEAWENSSHGQAMTDSRFTEAWAARGEPRECLTCHATGYDSATDTWHAEGITCEACHSPLTDNHPIKPMPADRSANLCGQCHTETVFEWQVSSHRFSDLTCVDCHGQHSTNIKTGDASALCSSCHRDRASNYAHSQHSQEGLSCADCHLGPLNGEAGGGHATRDHSFHVRLSTCNECHAYQMHDPVAVHPDRPSPPEIQEISDELQTAGVDVSPEPDPVSPFSFALLSGLIGMAGGMILAPWLERWYRRFNRDDREELS